MGGEGGEGEGAYPMFLPLVQDRRNVVRISMLELNNILLCKQYYRGREESRVESTQGAAGCQNNLIISDISRGDGGGEGGGV